MTKFEQLDSLLEQGNGYITIRAVTAQGISKPYFAEYARSRELERVAHAYTNHAMHGQMICMFSTCATAISFFPTSRRWRSTV